VIAKIDRAEQSWFAVTTVHVSDSWCDSDEVSSRPAAEADAASSTHWLRYSLSAAGHLCKTTDYRELSLWRQSLSCVMC